ncbi:DUF732 domain-containing protein [Pseudonocardia alaniniphila]|uniref:DUF732 domain-containing protein n=1 Tax=Pseudonocardia alaniniphila TaxID=75291 RepID=A0ABS9TLE3_9PSEU|nr:DUF732 domain-containing protein [Pseudonocardia alaniniphila]MCH6169345.1 DUF732 domain-containing protein [Pseudonocardia alaniniphila]
MNVRAGFSRAAVVVGVVAVVAVAVVATQPDAVAPAAEPAASSPAMPAAPLILGERQATYLEYLRQVAPGIPEGAAVQFGWDTCRGVNLGKVSVTDAAEIIASDTQIPAADRRRLVEAAINVLCPNGEGPAE